MGMLGGEALTLTEAVAWRLGVDQRIRRIAVSPSELCSTGRHRLVAVVAQMPVTALLWSNDSPSVPGRLFLCCSAGTPESVH